LCIIIIIIGIRREGRGLAGDLYKKKEEGVYICKKEKVYIIDYAFA